MNSNGSRWLNSYTLSAIQILCLQAVNAVIVNYQDELALSRKSHSQTQLAVLYFALSRVILILASDSRVTLFFQESMIEIRINQSFKLAIMIIFKFHLRWTDAWKLRDFSFDLFDDGFFIAEGIAHKNFYFSARNFFIYSFISNLSEVTCFSDYSDSKHFYCCLCIVLIKSLISSSLRVMIFQLVSLYLSEKQHNITKLNMILNLMINNPYSKEGIMILANDNLSPLTFNKAMSSFLKGFETCEQCLYCDHNENLKLSIPDEFSYLISSGLSKHTSGTQIPEKEISTSISLVEILKELIEESKSTLNLSLDRTYNMHDSRLSNSSLYLVRVIFDSGLFLIKFELSTSAATFNNTLKKLKSQLLITILHDVNNSLNCFNYLTEYFPEAQIEERQYIVKQMQRYQANLKFHIFNYCVYFKLILDETLSLKNEELNLLQLLFSGLTCILGEDSAYEVILGIDTSELSSINLFSDRQYLELLITNCISLFTHLNLRSEQLKLRILYTFDGKARLNLLFFKEEIDTFVIFNKKAFKSEDTLSIEDSLCSIEILKEIIFKLSDLLKIKSYDKPEDISAILDSESEIKMKGKCLIILVMKDVYKGSSLSNQISNLKYSQLKLIKQAIEPDSLKLSLVGRRKSKYRTEIFLKARVLDELKKEQFLKKNSVNSITRRVDKRDIVQALKEFYSDEEKDLTLFKRSTCLTHYKQIEYIEPQIPESHCNQFQSFEESLAAIRNNALKKDNNTEIGILSRVKSLKYDTPVEEIDNTAFRKMTILAKKSTISICKNKGDINEPNVEAIKLKVPIMRSKSMFSKLSFKSASSSAVDENKEELSDTNSKASSNYFENLGTSGDELSLSNEDLAKKVFHTSSRNNVISELGLPSFKESKLFNTSIYNEEDKLSIIPNLFSGSIGEPQDAPVESPIISKEKKTKFILDLHPQINNIPTSPENTSQLLFKIKRLKMHDAKSLSTKNLLSSLNQKKSIDSQLAEVTDHMISKRTSWCQIVLDGHSKIRCLTQNLQSRNVGIIEKLCDLRDENYFHSKKSIKRNPDLPKIEAEIVRKINCSCKDILVVDDEPMGVKAIRHLLKKENLDSDFCNDGFDAVSKVKLSLSKACCNKKYKLIFMDLMMPVMKGDEASRQIETLYLQMNHKLNVIVVSAHENVEVDNILSQIKCIKHFVPKPLNKKAIEDILQRYYFK